MTVYSIQHWICDKCGDSVAQTEQTNPWSDPLVQPPTGWNTEIEHPSDYTKGWDLCPKCAADQTTDGE